MPGVIIELTNLGLGSEASNDKLAASICRDAIEEIQRLRESLSSSYPPPYGCGAGWIRGLGPG